MRTTLVGALLLSGVVALAQLADADLGKPPPAHDLSLPGPAPSPPPPVPRKDTAPLVDPDGLSVDK